MNATPVNEYYQGKNVVVTGGGGFIGSHVVEKLIGIGANVRVPIRKSTQLDFLRAVKDDIELIEGDLTDPSAANRAIQGNEIVIHLAAAKGGGIENSMAHHGSLFRDNMRVAINVIEAVRNAAASRMVSVSSACVYPRFATMPIPEEEGFRDEPEPTNAGYGWSKRMQEYLAMSFAEEFGLDVTIVRPFNTYGPRDDFFADMNHVIPGLIKRVLKKENPFVVWGSGKQTRSFLYVEDCADGILLAGTRQELRGPFNLGSGEEISIGDLAKMILDLSGIDLDIQFDTSKPDGQPRRACDVQKAKEQIQFQTRTPLKEGLRRAIDWYVTERELREQAK